MNPRRHRLAILLVLLAFAAGTLALSRVRTIDGDEGYYATAARLVSEGLTPYQDFFYPQMPLLPYIYVPAYQVGGSSLANLRLMSVVAGILSLIIWWRILRRRWPERPGLILAGLALVAMNPYFLSWNVTVKTYALVNLGVFAVLGALDRGMESRHGRWFLLGGLAAGLCVGVRLLYLPWAVASALVVGWLGWRAGMFAALGGLALGLTPSALFLVRDPDRFLFNNYGYHQIRFSAVGGSGEGVGIRIQLALDTLGDALFSNPFMLFQLVLVGFGVDWARRHSGHPGRPLLILSGAGAVALSAASLLPDPVYEQYFTGPLTPLLAPLVVAGLAHLAELLKKSGPVLAGAMGLAAFLSVVDLQVRKTGMDWQEVWSFEHLARVSEAIESHSGEGDMVLAFWPGYVFESGRVYLPGLENHFALGVSEKLTLEQKIHYHLAGRELILTALEEQYPRVVVHGAWMHPARKILGREHLPVLFGGPDQKYELETAIGGTRILTRQATPGTKHPVE